MSQLKWKIDPTPGDYRILNAEGEVVGRFKVVEDVLAQEREGSQELEQAVGEAAAEIQRHSARINMKEGRAAVIAGTDQIEPIILKHLSPLFTRLSQRITEWEERWSKDASQSESECRARDKRIADLEAQAGAMAEIRMILAKPGLDGMGGGMSWVEKLREIRRVVEFGDAGKSLLAELVELREKWERAKGVLTNLLWPNVPSADDLALMVRMCTWNSKASDSAMTLVDRLRSAQAEAITLLSSSAPGQALECLSHPGPAGEPLTEEEKSRMGLVDGTWPADAETKGGKS